MELNQLIELEIRDIGIAGEGIGVYQERVVFVEGALPLERIRAKIIGIKKSYIKAELIEILKSSPHRKEPICPLFNSCGGCQVMHLDYSAQLEFKRKRVVESFRRIGGFQKLPVADCVASPSEFSYRNKIQLPVTFLDNEIKIGFYAHRSHEIVPLEQCMIHADLGEEIFQKIKELLKRSTAKELRHIVIKSALKRKEVLVLFVTWKSASAALKSTACQLMQESTYVKGVIEMVNGSEGNVILGKECRILAGDSCIYEEIRGVLFKISPASFFQVNPFQAEQLYEKAIEIGGWHKSDRVIDAYCGVGTLSLQIAPLVDQVVGMECVSDAIRDARENAQMNGIFNCQFECGDVAQLLSKMEKIDGMVLNPPRKGCDESVLKEILRIQPKRLVYISCDPATLARDCLRLSSLYEIEGLFPYDMFPQTTHIETIASLKGKYAKKPNFYTGSFMGSID